MDNVNRKNGSHQKSHVAETASDLLNDGKKLAHELYEEGMSRIETAEDSVKEYSDELLKKVQQNPITSVLIAGGVGFLLSKLLKK